MDRLLFRRNSIQSLEKDSFQVHEYTMYTMTLVLGHNGQAALHQEQHPEPGEGFIPGNSVHNVHNDLSPWTDCSSGGTSYLAKDSFQVLVYTM